MRSYANSLTNWKYRNAATPHKTKNKHKKRKIRILENPRNEGTPPKPSTNAYF